MSLFAAHRLPGSASHANPVPLFFLLLLGAAVTAAADAANAAAAAAPLVCMY